MKNHWFVVSFISISDLGKEDFAYQSEAFFWCQAN